ncbi:YopX family protein [Lacticaseibacillus paracasei]|uniref:YopX family protein n=1 Tax=Lacticaseibacillus paracasei TaxID=1597 RepID=UPI0033133304
MKREIKFRAFLNSKYYEKPLMLSWEELLEQYDAIDMFQRDLMTLMQYTGLHDKNGREIYEGDVVRTGKDNIGDPEPMIGQVIMREGSWIIENEKKQEAIDLFSEITSREVIGNIFEDKQLLEGKQ